MIIVDKKIEEGLWIDYIQIVYGIKTDDNIFQILNDERKLDMDNEETYHEGNGPSLFRLHEDVYGLDGYWIGDINNPKGLIIGCLIDSINDYAELNFDDIKEKMENFSGTSFYDYEQWANEFLEEKFNVNIDFKLHVFIEKYFLSKKEIEEKYNLYPSIYPQYKDYLEADCWEIREII
jgi:hypothetical protein